MPESLAAIVTGAAQGIGAAIVVLLLKKGYKVCVADIQEEKGKEFVKQQQHIFGDRNVIFAVCDVSKEADYRRIFDLTRKQFKQIDLVVNNAGVALEHDAKKCVEINLIGTITGCQLALEYMGKSNGGNGGIVINTSSGLGFVGYHALPIYSATKHGIIGLTRSYGQPYHLDKEGVIFTALCPGWTYTDLLHDSGNSLDPNCESLKKEYIMSPEYLVEGISKILEDKINGSTLLVSSSAGYKYIGLQEEVKSHMHELPSYQNAPEHDHEA